MDGDCQEVILVGAHKFFLLYEGSAILKDIGEMKNGEEKRVLLTCFNKHLQEEFNVLTYCRTDLTSFDINLKCKMIDRCILIRL